MNEPCGCEIVLFGNELQATHQAIEYCPLHQSAGEMLAQLKELRRTIDEDHWYADDLTAIIKRAEEK